MNYYHPGLLPNREPVQEHNIGHDGENNDSPAYYLDRGSGYYTRLIPADTLSPLNLIPAREAHHANMVVLPPLQSSESRNIAWAGQQFRSKVRQSHRSFTRNC